MSYQSMPEHDNRNRPASKPQPEVRAAIAPERERHHHGEDHRTHAIELMAYIDAQLKSGEYPQIRSMFSARRG